MRKLRTSLVLAGLFSLGFLSLGCHTTAGAGRDLEHAGREIRQEAREHHGRH